MTDNRSRQVRAVLRTAALWGAAWTVAGGAIVFALALFDSPSAAGSPVQRLGAAIVSAMAWGVRFGIAGVVIGAAFAGLIRFGYRGRQLADINPVRFTLLGAVIGGVGVPLYLQMMNVLSGGGPIAWNLVTDDAMWAAPFGAVVAAGTILLARRGGARQVSSVGTQVSKVELEPGGMTALDAPQLQHEAGSRVTNAAQDA